MKKVLVPKVRFKGFGEEWKEDTIGNIANITNGKLDANAMVKSGMYNFYTSGIDVYKIDKYSFEGEGISIAGNGVNMGYMHLVSGKYNAYQRTYILNNIKIDRHFLFYNLWKNFWEFCQKNTREGSIPYLLYNDISDFKIFKSHSNEQQKIGKLLDQISNLITLEEIKINKLRQLKKTLLEKMFPEHNSKKPRIRFKGFEGEWKEYKFNDIGSYYSTSSLSYNDLSKGGQYKCVLYGELYTKYNERIFNVISRTNKKITLTQPNDILFPTSTTVDSYSLISPSCVNEENVMAGGDLFGIRPYKNINGNFISYYINNVEYIKNKLANKAQGLTIIHLYYKNILNENLYIASLEEQNKIAKLFVKIDTLISHYQSKLNKLKQIKKALINKMLL
ncbi:restriction endonuclease subunit S [Mycoplasmopsis felis]|uniref:restriction endonuclease subunit S n=3 Tax=Mycoplasmopsis felis TaxID=33923 RepID=UPI002AFEAAEB|nr:restriction endonuclease subunit S [Mycoplasmopsis felis]WQQ10345.1 restriction endonuclease subunit S [Mycoplasmopsis felis]